MLQLLKPFLYLWLGLGVIDDVSVIVKVLRLVGASTFNRQKENPETVCNLCDDLMENILRGSEGFEAVPCSWICLRTHKCTSMCRKIKEVVQTSSDFPCIAAGYCEEGDDDHTDFLNEVDCKKGPWYSCEPKKFCRKKRRGIRYTCDLKPGMSRWVHMKKTASIHTAALASGLISPKKCDEPGAGPFCIARPSGSGRIAEFLGAMLSIFYGGYNSIIAIESPGGDDDQQWLTFWVMFVTSMILEQKCARVLLSKFPLYYQTKLVLIVWLMFFDGATIVYRKLRMKLAHHSSYFAGVIFHRNKLMAQNQLDAMISIGGRLIIDQVTLLERAVKKNLAQRNSSILMAPFPVEFETETAWEYDYTEHEKAGISRTVLDTEEKLHQISKWISSSDGMHEMENKLTSSSITLLLERAAPIISFHPKFLHILLISTKNDNEGKLPVMDCNGAADCYVKFSLVSNIERDTNNSTKNIFGIKRLKSKDQSTSSSIAYRTLEPVWNEVLEIPINGGELDSDGKYRNHDSNDKLLLVEAWDADCGKWGLALEVFQFLLFVLAFAVISAYLTGAIDSLFSGVLTKEQWQCKVAIMAFTLYVILGWILSYMMSVVWRADDEFIGSSILSLSILTDQREHSLLLNLRKNKTRNSKNSAKEQNGRGILRVRLCLCEQ